MPGVKNDVKRVKTALEQNGFNVIVKENLTKRQMTDEIENFLTKYGYDQDNRVLIYYAGHGHIMTNNNSQMGYVVPIDAPSPTTDPQGFVQKALPMNIFKTWAESSTFSKHALFIFDACFAGTIFSSRGALTANEVINYNTTNYVRQFIASGSANETVPDESVFCTQFVYALISDAADYNKDGYLTATELGEYLKNTVIQYRKNRQHPQYGKLDNPNFDKGDFVFVLNYNQPIPTPTHNPTPSVTDGKTSTQYGNLTLIIDYSGTVRITNLSGNTLQTKEVTAGNTYTFYNLPAEIVVVSIYSGSKVLWTSKISIPANSTTTIRAEKTTGSVELYTEIAGSLYLDDVYQRSVSAGYTYTISDLTVGSHTLRIDNSWQQTVYVNAGQTATVRAERPKGTLKLTTQISGNFYIDDILVQYVSTGTYTFDKISTGSHTAKIVSGGQTLWQENFSISANSQISLTAQQKQPTKLPLEPEMVFIKGGTFQMGSNDGQSDERPVHSVTVDDFYMGKYEVTVAEFEAFVNETGYKTQNEKGGYGWVYDGVYYGSSRNVAGINWRHDIAGNLQTDKRHPVIRVSWEDAVAYCQWLSKKTGKPYRLPTEAEWEYAAGNGSKHTKYSWGNNNPQGKNGGNVADETVKQKFSDWTIFNDYYDNYVYTAPVGQFNPNEFGLYDMSGNVWEWCSDWYSSSYYSQSPSTNPQGPETGSYRVCRGGSWYDYPADCRVALRSHYTPSNSRSSIGFRVCSKY